MPQTSKKQAGVHNFLLSNVTTKTESRWLLNMVCSKYSRNSLSNVNGLFAAVSPDSKIAKNFQRSSTKASYVATYGLAPYFHSLLLQMISSSPHPVVSFGKSLNNSVQTGQMDLLIRYQDDDTNRVCTCYIRSEFMVRSTTDDVLENFQNGISEADESKVSQVLSNGPNVNLSFLKNYASVREETELVPPCPPSRSIR